MKVACKTDIGKGKNNNQDNYRVGVWGKNFLWTIMCDGMGGNAGGEVASKIACDITQTYFENHYNCEFTSEEIFSFIRTVVDKINEAVYKKSLSDINLRGMGTTCVLMVIKNKKAYIAHVGDSRAYLTRNNITTQLTKDHSKVQLLIDKGIITKEQSYSHEDKNLITRAIGVHNEVLADYSVLDLNAKDNILICTDGLSNYIQEEEISKLFENTDFYAIPTLMINKVLQLNGSDNITVTLVGIGED